MIQLLFLIAALIPDPPILVILPDGTEVPSDGIVYDLDGRTVHVLPRDYVFSDSFE